MVQLDFDEFIVLKQGDQTLRTLYQQYEISHPHIISLSFKQRLCNRPNVHYPTLISDCTLHCDDKLTPYTNLVKYMYRPDKATFVGVHLIEIPHFEKVTLDLPESVGEFVHVRLLHGSLTPVTIDMVINSTKTYKQMKQYFFGNFVETDQISFMPFVFILGGAWCLIVVFYRIKKRR